MFRENAGFTVAAVSALAIGIGLNTAIFTVVNTVLLKPPPFPDADRIVMFMNTGKQGQGGGASPAKFNHWRAQTAVVEDVAIFRNGILNWTGSGTPEQLRDEQVSAKYFPLFGVPIIRAYEDYSAIPVKNVPGGIPQAGTARPIRCGTCR